MYSTKKLLFWSRMLLIPFLLFNGTVNASQLKSTKDFTIKAVNLITDRELEIVCHMRPESAQEVYATFSVSVGGEPRDYIYLSYFDFGSYADAPVINIRLSKPLDVGTLKGKTGVNRTPGEDTQAVKGPAAAAKVKVSTKKQTVTAQWAPFYAYKNIGSKSKLAVTGTNQCNTKADNDVFLKKAYSYEHVIDYAAGGINRMTGRAELITQNAVDYGVDIMLVGPGQSVYEAPQYRELFNPEDYKTRRIIEGSIEKPVIVATADDVMRQDSDNGMHRNRSDFFYLGEAFARLFWKVAVNGLEDGVTLGCRRTPYSVYNSPDDYRYDKHIQTAYAKAKGNNRIPVIK
jgi:PIN domain nuclease of toxin-antitoxin system